MKNKKSQIISFVKAAISSLLSAFVDLEVFYIICRSSKSLLLIIFATIIARISSGIINFLINKYWAFESTGKTKKEIIQFTILFIIKASLSVLLFWMFRNIKINQILLKAIIDFTLFFGSYIIQRNIIFDEK